MAISYQDNGNGTATVAFTYTANKSRVDNTLNDIAMYFHRLGYAGNVTWASLTNQQRLQLVDDAIKRQLKEWAATQHVEEATISARTTATTENETRYI